MLMLVLMLLMMVMSREENAQSFVGVEERGEIMNQQVAVLLLFFLSHAVPFSALDPVSFCFVCEFKPIEPLTLTPQVIAESCIPQNGNNPHYSRDAPDNDGCYYTSANRFLQN